MSAANALAVVSGVDPLTATALVAPVGSAQRFTRYVRGADHYISIVRTL